MLLVSCWPDCYTCSCLHMFAVSRVLFHIQIYSKEREREERLFPFIPMLYWCELYALWQLNIQQTCPTHLEPSRLWSVFIHPCCGNWLVVVLQWIMKEKLIVEVRTATIFFSEYHIPGILYISKQICFFIMVVTAIHFIKFKFLYKSANRNLLQKLNLDIFIEWLCRFWHK